MEQGRSSGSIGIPPALSSVLQGIELSELYRFAAFISYSSSDSSFASKLHQTLESYRIPRALGVFDLLGEGGKKNRVFPVFRDREELAAGALGERIEAALRASGALIVICSPAGVASPWVRREIEFFSALGRADRIFYILANDADVVGDSVLSCVPSTDGETNQEPLLADSRPHKDGYRGAVLKLVAGLIDVNVGALADRDRQRQRVRTIQLAAMVAVGLAAVAALGTPAVHHSLSERSLVLANLARTASDQGLHDRALRFALLGTDCVRVPIVGCNAEAARIELVRALDANSLFMIRRLDGGVTSAQFSPDGRLIATASRDGFVAVWNAAVEGEGPLFRFPVPGVDWASFSQDGTTIETLSRQSQIGALPEVWRHARWSVSDGVLLSERVERLNYGDDHTIFRGDGTSVTLDYADSVFVEEVESGSVSNVELNSINILDPAQRRILRLVGRPGNLGLGLRAELLTSDEARLSLFERPQACSTSCNITSAGFSPSGSRAWLIWHGDDANSSNVQIVDSDSGATIRSFELPRISEGPTVMSRDGRYLAVEYFQGQEQTFRRYLVYDIDEAAIVLRWSAPVGSRSPSGVDESRRLSFSPDGRLLAVAGMSEPTLHVYRIGGAPAFDVLDDRVPSDRGLEMPSSLDASVRLALGAGDWAFIAPWRQHGMFMTMGRNTGTSHRVAVSPDGELAVIFPNEGSWRSDQNQVRLWGVGGLVQVLGGYGRDDMPRSAAFSPDSGTLLVGNRIWRPDADSRHWSEVSSVPSLGALGPGDEISAFSADGALLGVVQSSGYVSLFDVETGRQLFARQLPFEMGRDHLRVERDGRLVVLGPNRSFSTMPLGTLYTPAPVLRRMVCSTIPKDSGIQQLSTDEVAALSDLPSVILLGDLARTDVCGA